MSHLRFIVGLIALAATACGLSLIGIDDESPSAAPVPSTDAGDVDADRESTELGDASFALDGEPPPVEAGGDGKCPPLFQFCTATGFCLSSCFSCPGAPVTCGSKAACVKDCEDCNERPFECYACALDRLTTVKASCEPSPASCYAATTTHCDCTVSRACAGGAQLCTKVGGGGGHECRGCGELGTDTKTCAGGGACSDTDFKCD